MTTAHEHRSARRHRIAGIRQRVLATSVAIFIALFAAIYVQMATGHDPALGSQGAATADITSEAASSRAESTTETESTTPGRTVSEESGASTDTPTAVTTSQS